MFVHREQLAYQLPPEHYHSAERHQQEIDRVFVPAWHLVGSTADLPRHGDFVTFDLFGRPLQIRNLDGRHHAFLNVCSHRHCLLTHERRGNSPQVRCQYHGWEYEASGRTRRIPDAGCFRPFDRENARLHKFPLVTCGGLLYVRLTDDGPSLEEFLGPFYEIARRFSQPPWRQNWSWECDYPCNWKLAVENTLESYHLPCIHKRTFSGVYPSEAAQQHELDADSTTLRYDLREDARMTRLQRWFVRQLGGSSTDVYTHHHIHPHIVFTTSDLHAHAQVYIPTSPTTCRTLIRMYSLHAPRENPWTRLLGGIVAWQGRRFNRLIQLEDASVFHDQQRGIEATRYRGCLGTREERLYAFQCFVAERVGAVEEKQAAHEDSSAIRP